MFLPKIMIERWGWWGFIAFAAPNVIGCTAFGYVLKIRQRSEAMVERHAVAMTWFSGITIAYHMFFIPFLLMVFLPAMGGSILMPHAAAVVVWLLGVVLSFLPNRDWLGLTGLVYGVSIVALVTIGVQPLAQISRLGEWPISSLAWLTPSLCFGFLLCPYLDRTFHRALQHSPSKHGFAVFGVSFAVMLLLTCALWFAPHPVLPAIALAHIFSQSTFTVGAHLREMRLSPAFCCNVRRSLAMLAPLAAAPLLLMGRLFSDDPNLGEDMYLRFLVFYGLAFPAYVLLFIGPWRAKPKTRGMLVAFGLAIAVSLPLYELGFIRGRMLLLVVPLIGLLAWAMLPVQRTQKTHEVA